MADLAAGRISENPFPVLATSRLRDYLADVTRKHKMTLADGQSLQSQPVDVLLLGGALRAMSDPDAESMLLYATGVPVGLGSISPGLQGCFPQSRSGV